MKIVNIIGGLGNQMLQYAYAIRWKAMNPEEEVLLDLGHFHGYGLHNGYELDRIFGQKLPTAKWWQILRVTWYLPWYKPSRLLRRIMPRRKTECIEKPWFEYKEIYNNWEGNGYFEGYWHYPELHRPFMDKIRSAFTFPPFEDEENRRIAHQISSVDSITLHIRRGDYVDAPPFKDICTDLFYWRAISKAINFCENPIFFIFSNDIEYCKKLFLDYQDKYQIIYVDHNHGGNSFRDMQLMTLAKVNIIANSSFSWWGAWLNEREGHQTITPTPWVNYTDSLDMIPKEWIKISGR
ncbi:alpha-1,2-fucosyltransferase [Prevotella sp. tf2-5]|uniref:alpha-1,2-fucosyltransferase n=1 Tax=Prevotella sp. tf2-5 TaxID=1761889 RepID=UPI0008EB9668|nr:alpha-1,2-fucosyltransferase [Prevotella sp. tf2-5]SFP02448.1 Glycosyl transferase family 11 [Prevotella sp. tf2-5]